MFAYEGKKSFVDVVKTAANQGYSSDDIFLLWLLWHDGISQNLINRFDSFESYTSNRFSFSFIPFINVRIYFSVFCINRICFGDCFSFIPFFYLFLKSMPKCKGCGKFQRGSLHVGKKALAD